MNGKDTLFPRSHGSLRFHVLSSWFLVSFVDSRFY